MSRFSNLSFAAAAIMMVAAGCSERAPRSFVQPNVIKKSDLAGTWHYIQTVTDAPATSSFMFIGNSSELMKIKFDIQEDTLFARRAYEQIEGSEDAYRQDPATYAGQPVAAWPIKSQFDIIRDYNATTGEETNRIIESTERAWNEREFIRVDWANNLITDSDNVGLGLNFFFADGVKVTSASYWESDPSKPDAFHMERADDTDADEFDKGEANYFDITNKWVISPTETTLSFEENGVTEHITYPSCFLAYNTDDCANQIVKVRHAFAKISPKHDYQPRNWDGNQMNLFGIWDVGLNRLTYNRQYGVTNSGFKRHAARFNVWKKSYQDNGKTPIEYSERQIRTTPYYAESSLEPFPPELFDSGKEIISQWNQAVKYSVSLVMGRMPDEDIFVWCHSPVKLRDDEAGAADPAACKGTLKPLLDAQGNLVKDENGDPIYKPRQGDPRRSTIFWVNQEQNAGPLGYGPPLFDIETGETISGQAYIYGAALDTYAARSRDLVLLLLGKIDPTEYINGQNVKDFVAQFGQSGLPAMPTMTPNEVKNRARSMDFSWARGLAPEAKLNMSSPTAFAKSMKNREEALYKSGVYGLDNSNAAQLKLNRLRGTTLEGMMVNSDIMQLGSAGVGTDWTALSDAEKARVSPLRSLAVRQAINDRLDKMRAFGYDFADFADEGVAQRAFALAHDPTVSIEDPEAIRQKLRKDIFLAVTLHEVGHNMGLRHNFRASWDAMNYFPQYWQLRDAAAKSGNTKKYAGFDPATGNPKEGTYGGGALCNDAHKGKIRPRYIDCPGGATSVDEFQGQVREFQYSSIMDYGAEFNSDLMGLGQYDKAAMKFSYAGDGYVEVFTDTKTDEDTTYAILSLHYFQNSFGLPSPINLGSQTLSAINYTAYPDLFNSGIDGIQKRKEVPYAEVTKPWEIADKFYVSDYIIADKDGNPVVPYYFCSDEFVGNLSCQRFDAGPDVYEQAQDLISRYENFYLLNNFKRDRYSFHTSLAYKNRVASRYLDILREELTWYALLRSELEDDSGTFFESEDGWGNFSTAVTLGFDELGNIIARPEAGTYTTVTDTASTDYPITYLKKSSDEYANLQVGDQAIGLLDGKYISTTWDFDTCGYYWADECQTRIGYFIDKTVALDVLTQSQAYFTGRDTSTDVRKYAIGYVTAFKKQLQEKFGALLAGDYKSLAPRLMSVDGQQIKVELPSWSLDTDGSKTNDGSPRDVNTLLPIDPATGFTLQIYAGVYGLSTLPTTFDHDFVDTTRIFVVGNGEAPVPDTQITCNTTGIAANGYYCVTDEFSGKSYAAKIYDNVQQSWTTESGSAVNSAYRNDTGVRMLQQYAAILAQKKAECDLDATSAACNVKTLAADQYKQNIDVMRSLHNAFGYATYKTDAPFIY